MFITVKVSVIYDRDLLTLDAMPAMASLGILLRQAVISDVRGTFFTVSLPDDPEVLSAVNISVRDSVAGFAISDTDYPDVVAFLRGIGDKNILDDRCRSQYIKNCLRGYFNSPDGKSHFFRAPYYKSSNVSVISPKPPGRKKKQATGQAVSKKEKGPEQQDLKKEKNIGISAEPAEEDTEKTYGSNRVSTSTDGYSRQKEDPIKPEDTETTYSDEDISLFGSMGLL